MRVRVKQGQEEEFLRRFEALRARIAEGVEGHVLHELCQDLDDPSRWVIASRWESLGPSEAWDASPEHRQLVGAMRECWETVERSRHLVRVEARREA